jgi:hypothetical protein
MNEYQAAYRRLPASQRDIIKREGDRLRANLVTMRAEQGITVGLMFGEMTKLQVLAKLGQFLNELEDGT